MDEAQFVPHFAEPLWLLAILLILPVATWLRRSREQGESARLQEYADAQLMPHLTGSRELKAGERRSRLLNWSLIWILLVLAMAGPRWDATRIRLITSGASLVVLMDISRSMEVTDVRPSRIGRARQEIEDLIASSGGISMGLIAFASVAHVISPITDDTAAIRSRLPAISTELVRLQGSRLGNALDQAKLLLETQPEENSRDILIISDGDFADQGLEARLSALRSVGIHTHILGIGTTGGGPVPGKIGQFLTDARRQVVESRLDTGQLEKLTQAGGGLYLTANFKTDDTEQLVTRFTKNAESQVSEQETTHIWNERFYLLLIPVLLWILPRFRRNLEHRRRHP